MVIVSTPQYSILTVKHNYKCRYNPKLLSIVYTTLKVKVMGIIKFTT